MLNFTQSAFEVPNYIDGGDQVWMWKDVWGMIGMISFANSCAKRFLCICEVSRAPS